MTEFRPHVGPTVTHPDLEEPITPAALDTVLLPEGELRQLVFLFRLRSELPYPHAGTLELEMGDDLGDSWDVPVYSSPKEGYSGRYTNLRMSSVSLQFWQPMRDRGGLEWLGPVVKVAAAVLPAQHPWDPDCLKSAWWDAAADDSPFGGYYDTVIEAVTQAARPVVGSEADAVTAVAFERCLAALNRVVAAYQETRDDLYLESVAPPAMDPVALVTSRTIDGSFDRPGRFYHINWNVQVPKEILTEDETHQLLTYLLLQHGQQPMLPYLRIARAARRALSVTGDLSVAVVLTATAAEVFLNAVLRMMLIEDGEFEEARAVFSDTPGLLTRLRTLYHPRLKGPWDPSDAKKPIGAWNATTYSVRNRVVHAGYVPSRVEADRAVEATQTLERFVTDRLVVRRFSYPKTALTKLGEPGLRRRGFWSGEMARVSGRLAPELPAFWGLVANAEPLADPR